MKKIGADFLRKAQFPFLIALGTAPLPLMILSPYVQGLWPRVGGILGAYALLTAICLALPGRMRLAGGGAGAAAVIALGFALLPIWEHVPLAAIPIAYAALLLMGLPMAAWPREREISPLWIGAGMVFHGAAQVLINIGRGRGGFQGLLRAAPGLPVCLMAFLALALLSANRASMGEAGMGRHSTPRSMRIKNAGLTLSFLAASAGIACLPGVVRALQGLWAWLKLGIGRLMGWLLAMLPETEAGGSGGGGGGMMDFAALGEVREPNPLLALLERVLMVLALIAVAVGAVFAVKFLLGRVRRLIRYLRGRMRQYAAAAGEDYVDEVTDTRDGAETGGISLLNRLRLDWGDERRLPPGKRIRRRYLRLRLRHREWQSSQTARETLPDAAARLYERARYSGHEITRQEAEDFEQATKRI